MAKTALGYRAEVVGSLLRPEYLKDAFDRFDRGEIDEDELVATQDRAALEAIALQEACGVDVITDGEVRRKFWFDPLTASLSGYNPEVPAPVPFSAEAPTSRRDLRRCCPRSPTRSACGRTSRSGSTRSCRSTRTRP